MRTTMLGAVAAAAILAGCGGNKGAQGGADTTAARDLQLAPTDSGTKMNDVARTPAAAPAETKPAAPKAKPAETAPTLAAGTGISATARDTVTSHKNKAGETMVVLVSSDVKDAKGRVVIPAGSAVTLHIDALKSQSSKSTHDSELKLSPVSVEIAGKSYPISGRVDTVAYILKGRGITGGTAAKVGAGAVAGAVIGRIVGGNKTGTIVGGVAGAAAGAAVANQTGDQDVTIYPGDLVRLTLTAAFKR